MAKPVILRFLADSRNLESAFTRLNAAAAAHSGVLAKTSEAFRSFGQSMQTTGRQLTTGLTVYLGIAGFAAGKLFVDFDTAMTNIRALVGVSEEQVKTWSDQILSLSRTLPQAPKELAAALYFVTSSGIDVSRAMEVVEASARAAAAGLGETSVVADAVTSAMNAYGPETLSAARATDILLATVREGKGEPDALAASIGRVIAPAQALGVTFDQVGGAIASMTLVGLDADEAATALRQTLMALQNPTKEQADALEEMGLTLEDVRRKVREEGLLSALEMLAEGANGNVEATSALFGNVRALNGVLIMTGKNVGNTRRIMEELRDSTGATDAAFDQASQSARFKLNNALSSLQATAIQLGAIIVPVFADLAKWVAKGADAFSKLSPKTQKIVVIAAAAAAAIGPLVFVIGSLAVAIGFLLSPVGLAVAAIAAIAYGFYLAYTRSEEFRRVVDSAVEWLRTTALPALQAFWSGLVEAATAAWQWIDANVMPILESFISEVVANLTEFAQWVSDNWNAIQEAITNVVNVISFVIDKAIAYISAVWRAWGDDLLRIVRATFDWLAAIIGAALDYVRGLINIVLGIINGDWSRVWDGIRGTFGATWQAITATVAYAIEAIRAIIGGTISSIQAVWNAVWGAIRDFGSGVWNAIVSGVSGALERVLQFFRDLPGKIWNAVASVKEMLVNLGKEIIERIIDGIKAAPGKIKDAIKSLIPSPGDVIGGIGGAIGRLNPFAHGGIVTRATASLIGEAGAEAVIPLTRPRRAAELLDRSGLTDFVLSRTRQPEAPAPVSIVQHITALDPREAARISADEQSWAMKTAGI